MDILLKSCISVGAGKLLSVFLLVQRAWVRRVHLKVQCGAILILDFVSCAILSLDKQINALDALAHCFISANKSMNLVNFNIKKELNFLWNRVEIGEKKLGLLIIHIEIDTYGSLMLFMFINKRLNFLRLGKANWFWLIN